MNWLRCICLMSILTFSVIGGLNAQLLEGFDAFNWQQKDSMISSVYGSGAFVLTKLMIDKAYEAAIQNASADSRQMARVNMWKGLQYMAEQNVDTAEQFLLLSKEIYDANPAIQDSSYQDVLINIADLKLLSNVEEACAYYQQAESYMEEKQIDSSSLYLSTINQIIACLIELGRTDDAESYGRKSINTARSLYGDKSSQYLHSLTLLGNIYGAKGENRRAANLILQAATLAETYLEDDDLNRITYWSNAVKYYRQEGQTDKVEETYEKMLAFYDENAEAKAYDSYPTLLNDLGRFYQQKGLLDRAYENYHRANILITLRREKTDPTYIISQMNVGKILFEQEKYTEAEQYYLDALRYAPETFGGESWTVAFLNQNLADVYQGSEEWNKALVREKSAFNIIEKALGTDHEEYAKSHLRLAQIYVKLDSQEQYLDYLTLAHDKYEQIFGNHHASVFQLNQNLIQAYKKANRDAGPFYLAAAEYIDHYAGEIMKYLSPRDRKDITTDFLAFLQQYDTWCQETTPSKDHLIQLETSIWQINKNKNRPSFVSLARYYDERSSEFTESYVEWQQIGRQIFDLQSLTIKDKERYPLKDWQTKSKQLENAMVISLSDHSELLPSLRKQLSSNQLLLYITSLPGKETDTASPLLFINHSLNQITYVPLEPGFGPKDIWEKIKPSLSGIKKIYILSEGNLNNVILGYLPAGPKKFVHNDYELIYLTSESAALSESDFRGKNGLLAFDLYNAIGGGTGSMDATTSTFPLNISRPDIIPDSIKTHAIFSNRSVHSLEMAGIEKVLGKKGWTLTKLSGSSGVEPEFVRRSLSEKPNMIHTTANGFFVNKRFTDPSIESFMFSGLVFSGGKTTWESLTDNSTVADGLLSAFEIALMDLKSVDLLVMSALSSSGTFDNGENLDELIKAFKMAGVKNLIVSMTTVSDKDSNAFMSVFYKFITKGQSIEDAFRNTQLKLQKKLDPKVWGSYVLIQ